MQKITCRLPFTTTGLAFCVNDYYHRFKSFSEHCTIHQFYRYTLMQFELKCFKALQKHYFFYPHLDNFMSLDQNLEELVKGAKDNKKNFASIVRIINSYGYFKTHDLQFCTVVPPPCIHSPHTIRICNLRSIVTELAAGLDKEFIHENTLPGAIYNDEGVLLNPDSIMPAVYDADMFHIDASAVELAFSKLDSNLNTPAIDDCNFSNHKGKAASLVSTWIKDDSPRDRIVPVICSNKDIPEIITTTPTSTSDRIWYSMRELDNPSDMNYGMLSYCGVWSKKLAEKWPDLNVRYPGLAMKLSTVCWSTIFNIMITREPDEEDDYDDQYEYNGY